MRHPPPRLKNIAWRRSRHTVDQWLVQNANANQSRLDGKWCLVVFFIGLHYCTIQIDMDTAMRPTEERFGGLTVEKQSAIDSLMAPYRRQWGDSPVLRRYERVPHSDAHAVAQRMFELADGEHLSEQHFSIADQFKRELSLPALAQRWNSSSLLIA
jgi:hypothetical protein